MNKKLPYEDAFERQMNDLPTGNEDESWQKMKALLDENEKRKPFILFRNYKAIILIFLLGIGTWFLIQPLKTPKEKSTAASVKNVTAAEKSNANNKVNLPVNSKVEKQNTTTNSKSDQEKNQNKTSDQTLSSFNTSKTGRLKKSLQQDEKAKSITVNNALKPATDERNSTLTNDIKTTAKPSVSDLKKGTTIPSDSTSLQDALSGSSEKVQAIDSSKNETIPQNVSTDQLKKTALNNENNTAKKTTADSRGKYLISAGIGLQQQLPLAGQKIVSYGYKGSKSTFSDYIPSIYLRFEKEDRWFLQGEFIYAVPQSIKAFPYSKQSQTNYFAATVTTTTVSLKKIFYNAVPISFNYYISPKWSVGVGGAYSWLHGAIAEKETTTNDVQTQSQSVVKEIVPIAGYTDSFLYKSHTYFLTQTSYQWRRFSVGLRYVRDVQSYIKYTMADGTISDKKNSAVELILRFRLFRLPKFSIK